MRAAVYLRQSLDASGEGLAVARQRNDCLALCEKRGWTPTEYVDNSVSASSRKPRPAYQRMLADIEAGLVDAVVVWDLDRLHRQPAELEQFILLADLRKIALATVTGDADLATDNGRLYARIKGAVARAEVERKSARQKAAHAQRATQGRPWANRRPFGFLDDAITHHPEEAPVLAGIYTDLLSGMSQLGICRQLNADGWPTTVGNPWRQNALRALILNPRNAGLSTRYGKVIGKAVWEPVVPEETWRAAVGLVTAHPQAGSRPRDHLLSGLLDCGLCGAHLTTGYVAGVRIYRCQSCHRIGRNADHLDRYITEFVLAILERPDARDVFAGQEPHTKDLQGQADVLRLRLEQLADAYADGAVTLPEWKRARDKISASLTGVEAEMSTASTLRVVAPLLAEPRTRWAELDLDRKRAVIRACVQVTVLPTGKGARFTPSAVLVSLR